METEVRLFASVAEMMGTRKMTVVLPVGATVEDLERELISRCPKLAGLAPRMVYALNEEYVARSERISPGDVVALIPPVSGG